MHRNLISLGRICQAGARNFFRNAWLSVAATAVMVVTLTVMLGAIILNFAVKDTIAQVTNKIDVAIFLKDEATPAQVETLQTELKQLDNVQSTKYISKLDALKRYREQNKDKPALLEAVSEKENPLPTSIEIQVKDLKQIDPIIALTKKEEYKIIVQDTSYGEDRQKTVQRIASINSFLTKSGIVVSAIFATIAVLIIFNTIRIAIFSRGEEIQIMSLVGATKRFIRGPFIFEAMLDGFLAAVFSLIICYTILIYMAPRLLGYVDFAHTLMLFEGHWTIVALLTMLTGMAIGSISSILAMARYLKL